MGDKTWHFIDCPKCGGKETVECFEHDSGWLKVDSCSECDYVKNYEYEEKDGVIHITEVSDLVATDNQSQDEPLKSATPDIDTQIESLINKMQTRISTAYNKLDEYSTSDEWENYSDERDRAEREATQAIKTLLDTAVQEARIDELEMLPRITYTQDGEVSDISILLQHQHIKDRIKELRNEY